MSTWVAGAGPPTPPATVEIVPAGTVPAGTAAAGPPGSNPAAPHSTAATVTLANLPVPCHPLAGMRPPPRSGRPAAVPAPSPCRRWLFPRRRRQLDALSGSLVDTDRALLVGPVARWPSGRTERPGGGDQHAGQRDHVAAGLQPELHR